MKDKKNKEKIFMILITVGTLLFFIAVGLIVVEVYDAFKFCKSEQGKYSMAIYPPAHFCNNQEIYSYNGPNKQFWAFKSEHVITGSLNQTIILRK